MTPAGRGPGERGRTENRLAAGGRGCAWRSVGPSAGEATRDRYEYAGCDSRIARHTPAHGRRVDRGFTLLEVLVALAILSLAVVVTIQGFAQGLRLLKLSGDHQEAMALADQKARETLVPVAGRDEGTEGIFRWERTTKAVDAPDLQPAGGAEPRWRVYEITVGVTWGGSRRVEVTTLRTVSVAAETANRARSGGSSTGASR